MHAGHGARFILRTRGVRELSYCIIPSLDTEPRRGTAEGGTWWDVAVTEVPRSSPQRKSRAAYERARKKQALGA